MTIVRHRGRPHVWAEINGEELSVTNHCDACGTSETVVGDEVLARIEPFLNRHLHEQTNELVNGQTVTIESPSYRTLA